jgi:hypothetical protein
MPTHCLHGGSKHLLKSVTFLPLLSRPWSHIACLINLLFLPCRTQRFISCLPELIIWFYPEVDQTTAQLDIRFLQGPL